MATFRSQGVVARSLFLVFVLSLPIPVLAQDQIKGAGATFPAAVYTGWGFTFTKETKVPVSYQATGSGDGIKQIVARSVDFGATDVPLTEEQLQRDGLLQFPTVVGGVVPVVNIPGVRAGQLRLTGNVLAKIFDGRISQWSDRELQALNPGVKLPALAIVPVVRAEASGTTATFTSYLSQFPAWKAGSGLTVKWPAGAVAVKGTDGVGSAVKEREGTIGYISSNAVRRLGLSPTLLQNKAGRFAASTEQALLSAVSYSKLGKGGGDDASLLDMIGNDTWPITDATFIVIDRNPKSPARSKLMLKFFYWVFLQGDSMATDTGFVPLPSSVQARIVASFRQVTDAAGAPLDFMSGDINVAAPSARN